jgi:rhamnogalacturonan endolyase
MRLVSSYQIAGLVSLGLATTTQAFLNATETSTHYILRNDRLYTAVRKSTGAMSNMTLDGTDMLGPATGAVGVGPYLGMFRDSSIYVLR